MINDLVMVKVIVMVSTKDMRRIRQHWDRYLSRFKNIDMRIIVISLILLCLSVIPVATAAKSDNTADSISDSHNAHLAYNNGDYPAALYHLKSILKLQPNNVKVLTDIGNTLQELGNYTGAISFYKKALSSDRQHIGAIVGIGGAYDTLGNHSAAVTYFKEVLAQPISSNTIVNETAFEKLDQAIALIHLKTYTQALSVVNQVLKLKPTYRGALNARGVILLYLGDYGGALNIFSHLLIVHPHL